MTEVNKFRLDSIVIAYAWKSKNLGVSCGKSTPCFVAQTREVLATACGHRAGLGFLENGESKT